MNIEEFAGRLEKPQFKNRKLGPTYAACCPAHSDKNASFAVWEGADGWLHVKCKAGCTEEAILGAMGLTTEDRRTARAQPIDQGSGAPEIVYPYVLHEGSPLFEKVRKGHGANKKFMLRRKDENDSYQFDVLKALGEQAENALYRVTEVIAAVKTGKRIWICEGEKAVEAFRARREVATCQAFGGDPSCWRTGHQEHLLGATEVIIVADIDEAGEDYAHAVASSLIGKVGLVRVVQSKSGGAKDDAFDHFAKDFKLEEFVERPDILYGRPLELEEFDDETFVESEVEFIWEPYFPKGKMVLLDADGGTGKTTFVLAALACLSRGVLPNNEGVAEKPYKILYLHRGEDSSEEIATVFKRNGGNLNMFKCYSGHDILFNPAGLQKLKSTIISGGFDIVVTDAFFYFISPLIKTINALEALLPILEGLQRVVRETGVTQINIRHTRKGQPGEDASDKGLGSVQFRNSHRGQLVMRWHPDKLTYPNVVVIEDTKGSLLVGRGQPLAFLRGPQQVEWVPLDNNPFDGSQTEEGQKIESAVTWVKTFVKQQQPIAKRAVIAAGAAGGLSQRTVERAAKMAGIILDRQKNTWSLGSNE
jgi:hypothetical protein